MRGPGGARGGCSMDIWQSYDADVIPWGGTHGGISGWDRDFPLI